ncbi:sensor histidine kinase [Pseudonocardia alni]|uniref:sensor histidine kinase n=1 Tax=Pseudonocardia alni TaxID=33907 RepID=UPI00332D59FD
MSCAVVAGAVDLLMCSDDAVGRGGVRFPGWMLPTVVVVLSGVLLLRRRRPRLVFAVQWSWGLVGIVAPHTAPFAGLLVALHAVVARRPWRESVPAAVACAVPFGVATVNAAAVSPDAPAAAAVAATAWAASVVTTVALGRAAHQAARRAALLAELAVREAEAARQAERLRLARELHDAVAHTLSGIVVQAATARVGLPGADPFATLATIESQGVRAMDELGRLVGVLRTAGPVVGDIEALVADAAGAGTPVLLEVVGTPVALDAETGLVAYRIVQEALTNARKHAGPSVPARVECRWGRRELVVVVRSGNPAGPEREDPLPSSGYGLRGLRERVDALGGRFHAGPDGDGYAVRAELPLTSESGQVPV